MDLELDPDLELTPWNGPQFRTHMVIKTLDGSSCKRCTISTSATYGIHVKKLKKKKELTSENGIHQ